MNRLLTILLVLLGFIHVHAQQESHISKGKRVIYHLYIADTTVNYTGKSRHAIAINGSIPAPTLYFTEGDTAEIYVHNTLKKGTTSIHWHGIILPNRFDGVPNLTTAPIKPGEVHLFEFPIIQNGTYWYHSHTELQEQSGMYGALIIYKKDEPVMHQYPVVLSDWIDENPKQVHRSLHNATDWYAIRKGSTQNYFQAIGQGYFSTKVANEWKRMLAMDVSDVAYDRFLTNWKTQIEQPLLKKGDKVKLRVVNGSAATYFWLTWSGGKITVVANDGEDIEPVEVDRLIIAVSETYDIIVTVPEDMSYQFLATAEDRTKSTSLWLGSGMLMPANPLPKLKYFEGMKMMNGMMKLNGDLDDMGMNMSNQTMDMNNVMYPEISGEPESKKKMDKNQDVHHDEKMDMSHDDMQNMDMSSEDIVTLDYSMLRSPKNTTLPQGTLKELHFELTGNMNRFVWSINNKTVSEADKILIHKGENIRIIMTNNTMMRHPMHLHGHYFRLLNGQGEHAPLKNVVDIMPMETDTLEFAATESGDWFFHCHILYHMMSGMGRIFSYENSLPNPELPNPSQSLRKLYNDDRQFHVMAKVGVESNGSDGEAMLANTRWKLATMWHLGYHDEHGYENEINLGKYLGKMQWLYPYVGFDYHYRVSDIIEKNYFNQISNKNNRKAFVLGVEYTLPMLIIADGRVDTDGKFRFQLSREDIPVTNRLRLNLMANTDKEYTVGLRYVVTKYFSLSTHYDSDMGWGGGVTITY
ncbi:MAG: multicopper oxidase domain-containing protein [Chitinophagales bacterium]